MNRLLVISYITVILSVGISAQRSVVNQPPRATQEGVQNQSDYDDAVPVVKDVVVYVNYEKDHTASIVVKASGETGRFTNGQLGSFLQSFSKVAPLKTSTQKVSQLNPAYVFKPDLSQTLSAVVDPINSVRNFLTNNITIDLNDGLVLYVKRRANINKVVRPNPLTLLIDLDASNKITLNGEDEGKLSDLNKLKNHLSEIFKSRIENGVFREGSNTVDTTVNLLVPNAIKFGEIQRLVIAVSSAGADRIFLVFDRQDIVRTQLIQTIEATPVIR